MLTRIVAMADCILSLKEADTPNPRARTDERSDKTAERYEELEETACSALTLEPMNLPRHPGRIPSSRKR